jgi:hypothetical protein
VATQVYGVTPDVLHDRFFPTAPAFSPTSRPPLAVVEAIIASVAAPLNSVVRGLGRDPATVTAADHPEAFAFLADTLQLGAHRRVGSAGIQGGLTKAMEADADEFKDRLVGLQQTPGTWLPELVSVATEASVMVASHVTDAHPPRRRFRIDDEG